LKKRTYIQPQFDKAEKEVKECKNRIITNAKIEKGQIV
jgi:phage-related minor tail protein